MDVPIEISFKDIEKSEALEGLIREKIAKLEQFHSHVVSCRVVVFIPHHRSVEPQPIAISVEVALPGSKMIVAKAEDNRESGRGGNAVLVSTVFDKVLRQIKDENRIMQGEVKAHASAGTTGRIARLFPEQNYGFVEVVGSPDLYFTRNAVQDGDYDDLAVGDMVQVTIATDEGPMGPQASSVRTIGEEQRLI